MVSIPLPPSPSVPVRAPHRPRARHARTHSGRPTPGPAPTCTYWNWPAHATPKLAREPCSMPPHAPPTDIASPNSTKTWPPPAPITTSDAPNTWIISGPPCSPSCAAPPDSPAAPAPGRQHHRARPQDGHLPPARGNPPHRDGPPRARRAPRPFRHHRHHLPIRTHDPLDLATLTILSPFASAQEAAARRNRWPSAGPDHRPDEAKTATSTSGARARRLPFRTTPRHVSWLWQQPWPAELHHYLDRCVPARKNRAIPGPKGASRLPGYAPVRCHGRVLCLGESQIQASAIN